MSMYAQPYRPSLATAAALSGIGDSFEKMALLREKEEGDLKLAEKKAQLSREEMRERLSLEWENKQKELAEKVKIAEQTRGRIYEFSGVGPKPKEEEFTRDYSQADELGQEQKVFDKEGYDKARSSWGRRGIMAESIAAGIDKPDAVANAVRKGHYTDLIMGTDDVEKKRQIEMAEGAKTRYGGDSTQVRDDWGGTSTPTEYGAAATEEKDATSGLRRAQTAHEGALTDKARRDDGPKLNTPEARAAQMDLQTAQRRVVETEKALSRLQDEEPPKNAISAQAQGAWQVEQQKKITAKQEELARREAEARAANEKLATIGKKEPKGEKVNTAQLRQEAEKALARGASRAAVAKRFKELTGQDL